MAPQKEKKVLMNYEKQANYRARKNRNVAEAKLAKKEADRLRYLSKRATSLENKLTDLQEKQRLLAMTGKAAKMEVVQAKQQELKLVQKIRDVQEQFNSQVNMEGIAQD